MNVLRAIVREAVSLFVDDWGFALALVAWIGLFAIFRARLPAVAAAPLLFVGLAVLTLVSVVRQAQRHLTTPKASRRLRRPD